MDYRFDLVEVHVSDSIRAFFTKLLGDDAGEDTWMEVAQDRNGWRALEEDYVREA